MGSDSPEARTSPKKAAASRRNGSLGGRPAFQPTATMRRRVAVCAGGGMSHETIATALGISIPTLRKHFETELTAGAHDKRMQLVEKLHAAALKGNASAIKAYLSMSPEYIVPPKPKADAQPPAPAPALPEGKKAQQAAHAVVAQNGTDWEALLPKHAQVQ